MRLKPGKIIHKIRMLAKKKSASSAKVSYFASWKYQEECSKKHFKELKKIKEKIKNLNHSK
jgi:hypothetical protein